MHLQKPSHGKAWQPHIPLGESLQKRYQPAGSHIDHAKRADEASQTIYDVVIHEWRQFCHHGHRFQLQ